VHAVSVPIASSSMILNRQRRIRVPMQELREFLACAQKRLRLPAGSVTVCLVTDREIARWNRTYRSKPGPTDVLSFPTHEHRLQPAHARRSGRLANQLASTASHPLRASLTVSQPYLGDIAIAPAVARRNARRLGRRFEHEMRTLILHGLLHLLGYDHQTDTGQMERRERSLRRQLGLA
jgi:probable rRNA maturation factor